MRLNLRRSLFAMLPPELQVGTLSPVQRILDGYRNRPAAAAAVVVRKVRLVIRPRLSGFGHFPLVNFNSFIELAVYVSPFRVRAPKRRV